MVLLRRCALIVRHRFDAARLGCVHAFPDLESIPGLDLGVDLADVGIDLPDLLIDSGDLPRERAGCDDSWRCPDGRGDDESDSLIHPRRLRAAHHERRDLADDPREERLG